jgi:hypothetical protein
MECCQFTLCEVNVPKLLKVAFFTIFLQSWYLEPENQRKTSQIVGIMTSNGYMDSSAAACAVEASTSTVAGEETKSTI